MILLASLLSFQPAFLVSAINNCATAHFVAVDLRRVESVIGDLLRAFALLSFAGALNTCYCILLVKESTCSFASPHAALSHVCGVDNPDDTGC